MTEAHDFTGTSKSKPCAICGLIYSASIHRIEHCSSATPVVDENTDSISLAAQEIVDHFAFAAAVAHNNNFMLPRQDTGRIESIIRKHIEAAAATAAQSGELDEATMEWALRELADGWIQNNEREGPHGFYQNARRVLNAIMS